MNATTQPDWRNETPMARCIKRLNILIEGVKHATLTLKDDPNHHIANCKCGKGITRNGQCSDCLMRELKMKAGL